MKTKSSRRDFLSAGVALPLAGLGTSWQQIERPRSKQQPDPSSGFSYRILGGTRMRVTTVGFGCMITSDPSVIERAADIGINYFDTARGYQGGNNERMVGAALKRKRKEIVLSTKSGSGSKEGALKDLDTSLRELGTDHVDIWYLHGKDALKEVPDELFEAQQLAKQQGKIRFAGLSTHEPRLLIPFLIEKRATERRAGDLQLHDGQEYGRGDRAGKQGRYGRGGDESDGGRLSQDQTQRPALRKAEG